MEQALKPAIILSYSDSNFDFDAWCDLAVRDPAGYFRERERVISTFIAERPECEPALRELQMRIDQVRAVSGSPAIAARALARMLQERLDDLSDHLKQLDAHAGTLQALARGR